MYLLTAQRTMFQEDMETSLLTAHCIVHRDPRAAILVQRVSFDSPNYMQLAPAGCRLSQEV